MDKKNQNGSFQGLDFKMLIKIQWVIKKWSSLLSLPFRKYVLNSGPSFRWLSLWHLNEKWHPSERIACNASSLLDICSVLAWFVSWAEVLLWTCIKMECSVWRNHNRSYSTTRVSVSLLYICHTYDLKHLF